MLFSINGEVKRPLHSRLVPYLQAEKINSVDRVEGPRAFKPLCDVERDLSHQREL